MGGGKSESESKSNGSGDGNCKIKMDPGLTSHAAVKNRWDDGVGADVLASRAGCSS